MDDQIGGGTGRARGIRGSASAFAILLVMAGCSAGPNATTSVRPSAGPSIRATTNPTQAPPSPTAAGVSLSAAFEPAFTLTYDPAQWNVLDDNQPTDLFLQYAPTGDALQLMRPDNVAAEPCDSSQQPAAVFRTVPWHGSPSDFIAWLRAAVKSTITVSAPRAVTVGDAPGLEVELAGKGSAACPFVRVSMWASDNSLRISTADPPSRLIALDVHGQTVLIWFHGTPPADVLATLEFR